MKIRKGFVSNSSSSSFVIVANGLLEEITLNEDKYVIGELGQYEFGWDIDDYFDIDTKINWAYLQASYLKRNGIYHCSEEDKAKWKVKGQEYLKMLTDVIKDTLHVREVIVSDGIVEDGYIDHQSSACEGKNFQEIFESEFALKQFIFCRKSYIHTDNDNH